MTTIIQRCKEKRKSKLKQTAKVVLYPFVLARRWFLSKRENWLAVNRPQELAALKYMQQMGGKELNWGDPQDLNEKINWLKFNTDLTEWTRLSDKYRVREYIKERGREDLLVPIYGCWEKAEDIDFNTLPDKFVLKTNHGCGTVMLVEDKSKLNLKEIRKELNSWLKIKFGVRTVEPQYVNIKPLLIAEKLLDNDNSESSSLVDYKVWCFDGKAYCIMVCANRIIGVGMNLCFYDLNWNPLPDMLSGHHKDDRIYIEKPQCLEELIRDAEDLAKGHPEVRVDFYIVNNKIYFGEMTFTSLGGYMDYISPEYLLEMGRLVTLPKPN